MRSWLGSFLLICSFAAHGEDQPSALVKTEPMHRESLTFTLSGYGTLSSDPASAVDIDRPRSGQITRLDVTAGQIVKKGTALFRFETDPVAASGYARAESAVEFARREHDRMNRLYEQRLATNSQLAAARKALEDAESALRAQKSLGTEMAVEDVKAPFDAVVTGIDAHPGDRVQAGKAVLQLARRDALLARIGIQPEDAAKAQPGMKVRLFPVFDHSRILSGVVGEVHGLLDPQTHLVDVLVRVDRAQMAGLVPGMKLRGEIEIQGQEGWVVPRSAVLTDEKGAYIFQDENGIARRVAVAATENGRMTAIQGKFDPRLPVVVLGNYELRDGMKLRVNDR